MSDPTPSADPGTPDLDALRGLPGADVAAQLLAAGRRVHEAVRILAARALDDADTTPLQAKLWLDGAHAVEPELAELPPDAAALLSYATARVAVASGDLRGAEEAIRSAQRNWAAAGDNRSVTRSWMGLTQVLAMQGRYAEAEEAALRSIEGWEPVANDLFATLEQAGARRNLATLYHYQERHAAALEVAAQAQAQLAAVPSEIMDSAPELALVLTADLAHVELARANSFTSLDQPEEAQAALDAAIMGFDVLGDRVNRGRARTNAGRLLLRRGDYAAALRAFDAAARDLLNVDSLADAPDDSLRLADELLLEHATGYLALNLLLEADAALARAEGLFRPAGQDYELGHTLYLRGLAQLRGDNPFVAAPLLQEALTLFDRLNNRYWSVRTQVALAVLDQRMGDFAAAAARLDALLAAPVEPETPAWDTLSRADALLLRGALDVDAGNPEAGRARALEAAAITQTPLLTGVPAEGTPPLPHLAPRIYHLLARCDRLTGNLSGARRYLLAAVNLLDSLRAGLPLEEIRTAFLDDKGRVYEDLVLALLDAPEPTTEEVTAAFDAVERARSRALLEQLIATVGGETGEADAALENVRSRLHWLYNSLLGDTGNRGLTPELTAALRAQEAAVQRMEWQRSPLLGQAQPVSLTEFHKALASDRQAVVYAVAGDELMAFVVGRAGARGGVEVVRHLCSSAELAEAYTELRFQLGRAALGAEYLARHERRIADRLRAVLYRIYQLTFEPLMPLLEAPRLLIVPAGALHGVPMHALWDGEHYLLERFEIAVSPSASMSVHAGKPGRPLDTPPDQASRSGKGGPGKRDVRTGKPTKRPLDPRIPPHVYRSWAGLALTDSSIPSARAEVESAARHFEFSQIFLDTDASLAGLRAAAKADLLHVATHGLFRSDNPYFSVLKLADGWIDVRELYRLPLQAQLVVLSACESGAGMVRSGEEVIGLARGFLAAGARSLVASIWHVHDASAAVLMEEFYSALTEQGAPQRPAAALRRAQQRAIAAGRHPWFWASFFVIGE